MSQGSAAAKAFLDREAAAAVVSCYATAHQLHNVIAMINGDRATVTSIVDAVHVVGAGDRALLGDLIGRYTHRLVRRDGWKIAGVTLAVVAYPAGKDAFEAAFAAARAILAEGNPA